MRTRAGTVVATAVLVGTGLASLALGGVALVVAGSPTSPTGPASPASSARPSGSTGTVTGSYTRVGGPEGTRSEPLPGTISFASRAGATITFSADRTGRFAGRLPAGTYTVIARSSYVDSGVDYCSVPATAQVRKGRTIRIAVVCSIS